MLSKRTIIGMIVGSIIIGLGGYSIISHIGPTVSITENFVIGQGDRVTLKIPAPNHASQHLEITGDTFDLKLKSPGDGLQIPNMTSYVNELTLDWTHLQDGETNIVIQNTGDEELNIKADTLQTPDPIGFTFDLMVITSGVIIIGFSMGFTLRKPKGF